MPELMPEKSSDFLEDGMVERVNTSFIWSVADLLRGDYKAVRLWQGHPAAQAAFAEVRLLAYNPSQGCNPNGKVERA